MATAIEETPTKYMTYSIETPADSEIFECPKHTGMVLNSMLTLLNTEQLCDVVLIAGVNKRVNAHRLVLAATSEYFRAMLTASMRESKENEIHLQDVKYDDLEKLVQFCYTGSIVIRENNVLSLLSSANLLRFDNVENACAEFLVRRLHPSNCLKILALAQQCNIKVLQENAQEYLCENFMEICKTEEFFNLTANELHKILALDDIAVDSEELIFNSLMKWIEYDKENREDLLHDFLSDSVRLWRLDPSFISTHVEPLCKTIESKVLLWEAMKWVLLPEDRSKTDRFKARKTNKAFIAIFRGNTEIHLHCYFAHTNKWNLFTNLKFPITQFGVAVIGNKIFIVGGIQNNQTSNTLYSVDIETYGIMELSSMSTKRESVGAAVLDGFLYAVGGYYNGILNTVERWDPKTNTWCCISPMLQNRCEPRVVALDGLLYAIGGFCADQLLHSVECYDPRTNEWTVKAPMSKTPHNSGIAVIDDFIYAVDGYSKNVERYNPATNTWISVCSLSHPLKFVKCASLAGRLIAAGSCGKVEEYNPSTNQWKSLGAIESIEKMILICLHAVGRGIRFEFKSV